MNFLIRSAASHSNDNRAGPQRIGQPTKASQRDRAIGFRFFRLDRLPPNDASPDLGATTMTRIDQSADILNGGTASLKKSINLVEQKRRRLRFHRDAAK